MSKDIEIKYELPEVEILHITERADELIETAARTCYRSEPAANDSKRRRAFIQSLIKRGHESVLEHATVTFRLTNVTRALTHQLVRHRLASYSQESQRYTESEYSCKFPNELFFISTDGTVGDRAIAIYNDAMEHAFLAYRSLLDLGVAREVARYVLPNAATTTIVVTMNFRELRHFFKLRTHPTAQEEIRKVANKLIECISGYRWIFEDCIHKEK